MTITYRRTNTDSDLSGGADFSKAILDPASDATGSSTFGIENGATEDSFAWTAAGEPGVKGTTGNYTVEVEITTGATAYQLSVAVARVNSSGIQQAISSFTSEQQCTAGTKTFSLTSINLGTWNTGDRLRVTYRFRSTNAHGGAPTLTISHGGANNEVVTPFVELTHRTLTADPGGYAKTGTAASLEFGRAVDAGAGSYSVSGVVATLARSRIMHVDAGALAVTSVGEFVASSSGPQGSLNINSSAPQIGQAFTNGSAAGRLLSVVFELADANIDALSGTAVARLYAASGTVGTNAIPTGSALATSTSSVDLGTLSTTLTDTTFDFDGSFELQAGEKYAVVLDATGIVGTLKVGTKSSVDGTQNYSQFFEGAWAGGSALDVRHITTVNGETLLVHTASGNPVLTAGVGSLSVSGSDASLELGREVAADAGSYTITGTDASLERGFVVTAEASTLSLSGTDVTLTYAQSLSVAAEAGAYVLTGTEAMLERDALVALEAGSYVASGQVVSLEYGKAVDAGAGTYAVSGQSAGLLFDRVMAAETTAFTVNGQDATLTLTSPGAFVLNAEAGNIALTGQTAGLQHGKLIAADAVAYTVTGQASTLLVDRRIVPEAGAFTVDGVDATLLAHRAIAAEAGALVVNGQDVTLNYSGSGITAVMPYKTIFRLRRGR